MLCIILLAQPASPTFQCTYGYILIIIWPRQLLLPYCSTVIRSITSISAASALRYLILNRCPLCVSLFEASFSSICCKHSCFFFPHHSWTFKVCFQFLHWKMLLSDSELFFSTLKNDQKFLNYSLYVLLTKRFVLSKMSSHLVCECTIQLC